MEDVAVIPHEQQAGLIEQAEQTCRAIINSTLFSGVYNDTAECPPVFDNIMCWPPSPAGETAMQLCPNYIHYFRIKEYATRDCLDNSTWVNWTNFSSCLSRHQQQPTHGGSSQGIVNILQKHMSSFRLMYNIGFGLSLVSLTLAVLIMLYFRRLHCARNFIHLNLFLAFILRAAMNIIRDNMFVAGLGFPSDVEFVNNTYRFKPGPHIECRLFYTVYQFVLMASYMWIFVEAVYLHMIVFISVFSERIKVYWYIIVGWALPLPFVLTWAICRYYLDNTFCWNTSNNSPGLTYINKVPVIVSIVLNVLFFINIVRLLFIKLYNPHFPDSTNTRSRTLARSILILIPVFGVYYLVFAWPMDHLNDTASFVMLFIEMVFNSFQGVIIAFLLCFINAEVRSELLKMWHQHKFRRCSTASRMSGLAHTRETSCTRMSSFNRASTVPLKNYRVGAKSSTSSADQDETVPFTNNMSENTYSTVVNGTGENETEDKTDARASLFEVPPEDNVALKINIVNIECTSRDGLSRNTTSMDIQTLQNGCERSETRLFNFGINDPTDKSTTTTKHSGDSVFLISSKTGST